MHDLGRMLRKVHSDRKHQLVDQRLITSATKLYVWKLDVSRAYRLMLIHILWQILQIISTGGLRFVNWCNHFGNRAAGRIWGAFMGLVLWIAMEVWKINNLLGYVDDVFSYDFEDNLEWYEPYRKLLPNKQTRLLRLWDDSSTSYFS